MNNHPLLQYISITSKNLLWQFGNSGTFGIPEALKNSANEIYLQSKLANEGLYYLQVKTFLETLNLNENEVNQFMKDNSDHQRLGFEIFKILENTILEEQAKMLARSFKLLSQKQISKQDFDKYTYIIMRLNNHLIHLIQLLVEMAEDYETDILKVDHPKTLSIRGRIQISFPNPNMDLISFGFLEEYSDENKKMWNAISQYRRTQFFYEFYEKIFKD